jgi:hypothetical protein
VVRLALSILLVLALGASAALAGETTVVDTPRAPPPAGVILEIVPDGWPAMPRVLGYEYNQKNHHDTPGFEEGLKAPEERASSSKRRRFRVVGVIVRCGEALAPVEARLVNRTKGAAASDPVKLKLGPKVELLRFFVVGEDANRPVRFELLGPKADDDVIASAEKIVGPEGRTTANPYDARFVCNELNNEQRMRESFPSFPVSVRVMNDSDQPVAGARLTMLHDQYGLIETAVVGDDGRWKGRLLGGAWTAIAFGTPKDDPSAQTVLRTPRAVYLIKSFESSPGATAEVELRADQSARVKALDADGKQVELQRLTVTPRKIAEALKYADVHDRCAGLFSLDLEGKLLAGALDLLTNKGASYDLAALVKPADGVLGFLHAAGFDGQGALPLTFAPSKMARYIFDAPTGFGGGKTLAGTLTLLDAERQSLPFHADELLTLYAPAGPVRIDMQYACRNGDRVSFVPRRIDGKPGAFYDLTPRPPFNMTIFCKSSRGIQIYVAITDGTGQIVEDLASQGWIKAFKQTGEPLFELTLAGMRFMFPTGMEKVDLSKIGLETKLRLGSEWLRGRPTLEMVRKYAGHGSWAIVPRILEANAEAFLTMVEKSCAGEKKFLGNPPAPVGMDFEVFLPPGVGGTGGGGKIQLDLADLMRFCDETDALPYAYCHELGHNVGFGHDPYMLLAPAGVEEGMYGALGYRMKNGAALEQLFRYLEGRRHLEKGTWTLGSDLYGGLRLLYGGDVHLKMFQQQHAAESALKAAGLSSIERIATLYSLAVNDNVAWLFRAYGWPVFDFRVTWGRMIAATRGKDVQPLNADQAQALALRRWWVQEGAGAPAAGENGAAGDPAEAPWQAVTWPTDFIALDQGRPPTSEQRQIRLFARIAVPTNQLCYLVAASDVALEIALNGHSIARLDASPQLEQPVHDELMLDKKRAFPVILMAGENTVDVECLQLVGSKGFILGFCDLTGKPFPVKLRAEGPELEAVAGDEKKLRPDLVVPNGSFEAGGNMPAGWIVGPGEPGGAVAITPDGEQPATGAKCMRFTVRQPGTGALMQRVVVEPGAVYRVHARVRCDKAWDGDAFVTLFTGDVNAPITKTQPLKPGPRWQDVVGSFASQKRRVVYVCCWVKARAGVVWFDDVEMVREK